MLGKLLKRARFRWIADQWLFASAISGAVFLALFVILLLWGTAIVSWWIPVLTALAAFAAITTRSVLPAPSEVALAQLLDMRCNLADALGTAVHFQNSPLAIAQAQREQAERALPAIDLASAIPFVLPRSLYWIGALGLVASILLFIRFGRDQRLPLNQPMAQALVDPFGIAAQKDEALVAKNSLVRKNSNLSQFGTSTPDSPHQDHLQTAPGTALSTGGDSNKDAAEQNAPGHGEKLAGKMDGASGNPAAGNEQTAEGSQKEGSEQTGSSQEGAPQSAQAGGKSKGASESSGMLSKLRDAVASLMSKMQPQAGTTGKPQQANGQQTGQQSGQKQGQQAGQAGQQPTAGGNEPASSDDDQSASGKGAANSKDQNASAKPGSGMGRQDGSKEIQDAEQLAAMGKLTEIIGKRSANLTGEMTIESQSGPQQLKTGYTSSTAKHGQATGDVNRDEVPLEMQPYVQQYFNEVRKQAAAQTRRNPK